MAAELHAVLLDLDGTLIDRDAALRAWLRRRAGLGGQIEPLLALDRSDQASLVALSVELLRQRPGLAADSGALVRRIREELPGFIQPDPEVNRALSKLTRAGLRLALISNGGSGQRRKLAAASISERLFSSIRISGEFGRAKPEPAIFESALRSMQLGPEHAIMIGDSPREDIAGALALGIATCWIARGRDYPSDCPAPNRSARDVPIAVDNLLADRS